jgi:two-component system, NarL family, nitrate/nitrite response regulator NarL
MNLAGRIRVMLVDRHQIVLWGLQRLLEEQAAAMELVATATNCARAIEIAGKSRLDVIVLDSELLAEEGPGIVPTLANAHGARVIVLSSAADEKLHDAAILQGAHGIVHKEEPPQILLKAIAKVFEGELWLDRARTGRIFVELSRQKTASVDPEKKKLASLTEREQDVVRRLASHPGADNRKLAEGLHIGEHTLRNHLSRIYDKLGVPNRLELYVFAHRHGLAA